MANYDCDVALVDAALDVNAAENTSDAGAIVQFFGDVRPLENGEHIDGIGGALMNCANRLTLSRLALTVLFVVALSSPWRYAHTTALITFLVAGITDFFDGEIARRYQTVTNFGKLMDPLVDKIMIAAAF